MLRSIQNSLSAIFKIAFPPSGETPEPEDVNNPELFCAATGHRETDPSCEVPKNLACREAQRSGPDGFVLC